MICNSVKKPIKDYNLSVLMLIMNKFGTMIFMIQKMREYGFHTLIKKVILWIEWFVKVMNLK